MPGWRSLAPLHGPPPRRWKYSTDWPCGRNGRAGGRPEAFFDAPPPRLNSAGAARKVALSGTRGRLLSEDEPVPVRCGDQDLAHAVMPVGGLGAVGATRGEFPRGARRRRRRRDSRTSYGRRSRWRASRRDDGPASSARRRARRAANPRHPPTARGSPARRGNKRHSRRDRAPRARKPRGRFSAAWVSLARRGVAMIAPRRRPRPSLAAWRWRRAGRGEGQ